MILLICSFLLMVPAVLVAAYYLFLAIASFLIPQGNIDNRSASGYSKFVIVIPAHNEERVIAKTLDSCARIDYPKDSFRIAVIADNCTDDTAKIAQSYGALVLERTHDTLHGKGYALEWAFNELVSEDFDGILVLDADCVIDSNVLEIANKYFAAGCSVLQTNNVVSNPDESSMSYMLAVGNSIENELFYKPKSGLGLAIFLRGTGMIFKTGILQKYPWKAHSIAEDADYTINLIKNHIRVKFISETKVASPSPSTQGQLSAQRNRWAGGNMELGRLHAIRLILKGVLSARFQLIDSGWTLLVLSRPVVLLELLIALAMSLLTAVIVDGDFSSYIFFAGLAVLISQFLYFGLGIISLGLTRHRLRILFGTPLLVLKLIKISIAGFAGNLQNSWVRTPR